MDKVIFITAIVLLVLFYLLIILFLLALKNKMKPKIIIVKDSIKINGTWYNVKDISRIYKFTFIVNKSRRYSIVYVINDHEYLYRKYRLSVIRNLVYWFHSKFITEEPIKNIRFSSFNYEEINSNE